MTFKTEKLPGQAALILYGCLWAVSTFYLYLKDGDWVFAMVSLGLFGITLSALAWFLTRGAVVPETPVARPKRELMAVLGYLVAYTVLFLMWGMSFVKGHIDPGRMQDVAVLGTKLLAHGVFPVVLLLILGAQVRPLFDLGLKGRRFGRTFVVLGLIFLGLLSVVSPSIQHITDTGAGATTLLWAVPLAYLWLMLEVGVCEEFLFRAVLQTRLTAVFKSFWAGIFITSIIFALVHVPGLYLRGSAETFGTSPDPWQVAAYTVAILSPISVLFGVIWARTRSFLLVVMLHASVDLLPHIADFIKTWAGPQI